MSYDTCLFWEEVVKKIKPLGHNQLIGGSFRGVGTEAKVTCVPAEPGRVNAEEDPGGDREWEQCNQVLADMCTYVFRNFHALNQLKTDLNCLFIFNRPSFKLYTVCPPPSS